MYKEFRRLLYGLSEIFDTGYKKASRMLSSYVVRVVY